MARQKPAWTEKRPSPKNQRWRKVKMHQRRKVLPSKVRNFKDIMTFKTERRWLTNILRASLSPLWSNHIDFTVTDGKKVKKKKPEKDKEEPEKEKEKEKEPKKKAKSAPKKKKGISLVLC